MANTERRSKTRRGILVALLLVLLIYIIGSTYARYTTTTNATGKVQVAKWAVAMTANNGTKTLSTTTQDITFTVQNNSYVVAGKIAPDVTAVADIELDLTGTEVAVDFLAEINSSAATALSTALGASADDVEMSVEINGTELTAGTPHLINLPNGAAFTAANGKIPVTLTLTWTNNESHNTSDTAAGVAAPTLSIPITLTAQQHVLSDD